MSTELVGLVTENELQGSHNIGQVPSCKFQAIDQNTYYETWDALQKLYLKLAREERLQYSE